MKKTERVLSLDEFMGSLAILSGLAVLKKSPIKRVISKTFEEFSEKRSIFEKERNILIEDMIVMTETGGYATREGYVNQGEQNIPLNQLIYQEGCSFEELTKKLIEQGKQEIKVTVYQEQISKQVQVSSSDGNFQLMSIEDLLYDPNGELTPADLIFIEKFLIEE